MTEEPYRWLEAINNRREYVREQLKGASPALAASLPDGIVLIGVGSGQSKVFELFDRHALVGLGHPADLEKIRQAAIDAAHTEAFTRAPEDVSLRRLVGFGLSPQLKTNFEQIFSAPFLVELILAEVGATSENDMLFRLHFDGAYQARTSGAVVAASDPEMEKPAQNWLNEQLSGKANLAEVVELMLQAWWMLTESKPFNPSESSEAARKDGWRKSINDRVAEIGWLGRRSSRSARYEALSLEKLGL